MTANELIDLLRQARATLDSVGQVPTGEGNSRARTLERRIDAALAEAEAPSNTLTANQQEWIVRICRAAVMWGQKSRAGSIYTVRDDEGGTMMMFTPLDLANRVLKEVGIEGRFSMPEPVAKKKKGE